MTLICIYLYLFSSLDVWLYCPTWMLAWALLHMPLGHSNPRILDTIERNSAIALCDEPNKIKLISFPVKQAMPQQTLAHCEKLQHVMLKRMMNTGAEPGLSKTSAGSTLGSGLTLKNTMTWLQHFLLISISSLNSIDSIDAVPRKQVKSHHWFWVLREWQAPRSCRN